MNRSVEFAPGPGSIDLVFKMWVKSGIVIRRQRSRQAVFSGVVAKPL